MRLAFKMAIFASGKSQRRLAADVGMSENRLSEIVRGWREPSQDEVRRLAAALNRPVEALLSNDRDCPALDLENVMSDHA